MNHRIRVGPLPAWLPAPQLLGEGSWGFIAEAGHVHAQGQLETTEAADLAARLRGVTLAGRPVRVEIVPSLPRPAVRAGRLQEAKRQRERSPGFTRAGVELDPGTRLGLTPEALALELGRRASKAHVIDVCCGAGGNAIGFARAGCTVTAIEIDASRLAMAKHNAMIYGMADRIEWLHGDARELLPGLRAREQQQAASHVREPDLWFIDVPWQVGGASPAEQADGSMQTLLDEILALRPAGQRAWAKVPAAFDPELVPGAQPCAYFGTAAGDARRVKFLILEISR